MVMPLALVWDLIAKDSASPAFAKVSAAAALTASETNKAAVASEAAMSRMGKATARTDAIGKSMTKHITLPFVALGGAAVMSAMKFQKAMLLIHTQAGASSAEVKKMSAAVLDMAGKVGTSPDKLATSLYHIESVGLRGAKALGVLKIAAEGAKVGNADLEQTTNALTSAVASGIKGVHSISQAMGGLNAIVGAGDMNLEQLNEALGSGILTKAKSFGVSLQEVGASLATFGDLNIRGADAATQLRMAIEAMAKQGTPGQNALLGIGIQVDQLRRDMEQHGLNGALLDLNRHLHAAGITGVKVGSFLLDAFSKKGASGVTLLLNNLARFETKMTEVAKGSHTFGSQWQATTQTTAYKFAKLQANLEVLGIQLGDKLLPVFTKVVRYISKAVSWFTKLSPAVQGTFIKVALLTAALGPLISRLIAVGKAVWKLGGFMVTGVVSLYRMVQGMRQVELSTEAMSTKSYSAGLKVRSAFGSMTEGVQRFFSTYGRLVGAAAGGVGSGLAFGMMARDASTAGKALGVLGGTLSGAAMGAAVGGGPGAAIGAVSGALTSLVTVLTGASAASKVYDSDVQSLTQAFLANNGAIDQNVRLQAAKTLQDQHVFEFAQKAGISLSLVTSAALDGAAAQAKLKEQMQNAVSNGKLTGDQYKYMAMMIDQVANTSITAMGAGHNLAAAARDANKSTKTFSGDLRETGPVIRTVSAALKTHTAAVRSHTAATKNDSNALQYSLNANGRLVVTSVKAGTAIDNTTAAMKDQTVASGILKNALDRLNGVNMTVEQANDTLSIALGNLRNKTGLFTDANGHLSRSLDQSTIAGATNRQMLAGIIQNAQDAATAVADHAHQQGKGLPEALRLGNAALRENEQEILRAARSVGFNTQQVQALIDSLGHLAKLPPARPRVILDTHQAYSALSTLLGHIDNATARVNVTAAPGSRHGFAVGGAIFGPGGPRDDRVLIAASNGEHMLSADDVSKVGGQGAVYRLRSAIQAGLVKFAGGGAILSDVIRAGFKGNSAQIMAAIVEAESGGNARAHNYNPSTGDDSYGLAQINLFGSLRSRLKQFGLSSASALYDPVTNLRIAYALSGGGRNFSPWTTFTSGAYSQYLGNTGGVSFHGASTIGSNASPLGRLNTLLGAVTGNAPGAQLSAGGFSWREFAAQITAAARGIYGASGVTSRQRDKLISRLASLERQGLQIEKQMQKTAMQGLRGLNPNQGRQQTLTSLVGLENSLAPAGVPWSFIHRLYGQNAGVGAAVQGFNYAARHLATAQQDSAAWRAAVTGTFDVTQAGANPITGRITGGSMLAQARQAVSRAKAWVAGIKHLAGMKIFPAGYLRALLAQGPAGLEQVQALLSLGGTGLRELAAQERALSQYGTDVANIAARRLDGGTVQQWENRRKRSEAVFRHEVDRLIHEIRTEFSRLQPVNEMQLVAMVNRGTRKNKRRA